MITVIGAFQIGNAQLKPEAGAMGLGFRITGIASTMFGNFMETDIRNLDFDDRLGSGLLNGSDVEDLIPQEMFFGRYYIASDLAVRFGLGINSTSQKIADVDSLPGITDIVNTDQQLSAFSFGISAGVEKHFASAAGKIDPYAGAQINLAMLGKIKQDMTIDQTGTVNPNTVQTVREWTGGSSFGIDLLAGFNFFFTDNFALGAEMSWGFGSSSIGGDYVEDITVTTPTITTTTQRKGSNKASSSGFRVGSTAGVNASIFW